MPVERGSFFRSGDGIVYRDCDDVAPVGFDCGGGKLAVDEQNVFLVAVWGYGASRNCEIVGSTLI